MPGKGTDTGPSMPSCAASGGLMRDTALMIMNTGRTVLTVAWISDKP